VGEAFLPMRESFLNKNDMMEWEDKVKMVALKDGFPETKPEFQKMVLDNLFEFDVQAAEIFLEVIELVPDEINENKEFYEKVYDYFATTNVGYEIGLRSAMRLSVFEVLVESFKDK
jgi:hypothetical protein